MLSVIVFDCHGWTDEDYRTWSTRVAADGKMLCLPTRWRGNLALRLAFVNPVTESRDVISVLEGITSWPATGANG